MTCEYANDCIARKTLESAGKVDRSALVSYRGNWEQMPLSETSQMGLEFLDHAYGCKIDVLNGLEKRCPAFQTRKSQ